MVYKIEMSYRFGARAASDALIRNALVDLLAAVRAEGSISGAARRLNLSYRHVWGELKRWEKEMGRPLILWDRGQAAQLSDFGNKLLWAERQAQARLAPQIAALHADLERAFSIAFDDAAHALTLHASHDLALVLLREHCMPMRLHLDVSFSGSLDALRALQAGRCTLAGFHLPPRPLRGGRIEATYAPLLPGEGQRLIGFARRVQGLAVAPGNPLGLSCIADVAARGARYVNRAPGTGTRLLTEALCDDAGIVGESLVGYAREETSHAAVAQAVAAGWADAGLCIEAEVRSRPLDFVPLLWEEYYLACPQEALDTPPLQTLLAALRSGEWQRKLASLAGYAPSRSGQIFRTGDVLSWAAPVAPRLRATRRAGQRTRR